MLSGVELISVDSSNIQAVGYSDSNLYVVYKSGTYIYKNVPKTLFEDLLKANSKGRFMCENVKGKYDYVRS